MNYTDWILAGNPSEHLDRVRAALTDQPQSRREIAEAADVSPGYVVKALAALIELDEARLAGARNTKAKHLHPAYLYTR